MGLSTIINRKFCIRILSAVVRSGIKLGDLPQLFQAIILLLIDKTSVFWPEGSCYTKEGSEYSAITLIYGHRYLQHTVC